MYLCIVQMRAMSGFVFYSFLWLPHDTDFDFPNVGNASTEKNGVSFSVQNGDVCLHDFTGKQHLCNEKEDSGSGKNRMTLRRTSKRGSLPFIEQM